MEFGAIEFVDNPDPRCAVVLILDTSASMAGQKIRDLNSGLESFIADLKKDPYARQRVELSVITCGRQAAVVSDFVAVGTIDGYTPLQADGPTPMGAAINLAIDRLESRKTLYRENGIQYFRPWIVIMTDGMPTDDMKSAVTRIHESRNKGKSVVFCIGIGEDANMAELEKLSDRVKRLQETRFAELFAWLSASLGQVSRSHMGDQVPLTSTESWEYI